MNLKINKNNQNNIWKNVHFLQIIVKKQLFTWKKFTKQ